QRGGGVRNPDSCPVRAEPVEAPRAGLATVELAAGKADAELSVLDADVGRVDRSVPERAAAHEPAAGVERREVVVEAIAVLRSRAGRDGGRDGERGNACERETR